MERNLLYVALTRTKKLLGYNDTVTMMINRVKRYESTVNSKFDNMIREELRELEMDYDFRD